MFDSRIKAVQQILLKKNIDAYIVFSSDYHGSEYIVDHFKTRNFLSGFTGSAATLLITLKASYLWTDGRYFLQAEQQLKGSNITLMKMGEKGVLSINELLVKENISSLLFDFKVASSSFVLSIPSSIKCIDDCPSIIDTLWNNRPLLPQNKVFVLKDKYAGEKIEDKIHKVVESIKENNCKYALISSLDDNAWLFNMRGSDIPCNPVFFCYSLIGLDSTILYINKKKLTLSIIKMLESKNITIKGYEDIYEDILNIKGKVMADPNKTNYKLATSIKEIYYQNPFITTNLKAIKNEVEIKNIIKAHIKDGIAMVKFMYYLKTRVGKESMSEISVSDYLEKLRRENGAFDLSFNTICGYNAHGAIVHYSANKNTDAKITDNGVLLVDSGGQYKYGTTDITRTFVFNNVSDEIKRHYTLVLKSHIDLARAKFKFGTTDVKLDKIARRPLLKEGLNFNHGTGHGIGYMLNVHEGPQSIRPSKGIETVMQHGMITSNEPGIYIENSHGIRHENEILCVKLKSQKLGFKTITYVPYDLDGIDASLLTKVELKWLNSYHKMVYKKISKYLNEQEKEFLKKATREINYDFN